MNHNHPLYLLAILAAAVSSVVVPSLVLWAAWYCLRHGQWFLALIGIISFLGYAITILVAVRGSQTHHYQVK